MIEFVLWVSAHGPLTLFIIGGIVFWGSTKVIALYISGGIMACSFIWLIAPSVTYWLGEFLDMLTDLNL